jgi:pantetheine-phosphate adenylyltransferase
MKRIAVFPGSFDPVTNGHTSIIQQISPLFDEIIVALGYNTTKQGMFTVDQRLQWLRLCFADNAQVQCLSYEGLTVDFCDKMQAQYIIRGLRNTLDFEYEKSIASMNQAIRPDIKTIFVMADASTAAIQSTIVRELLKNKGSVTQFIPEAIRKDFV